MAAQERIFGAAIAEAESYPRGAMVDQQYADLPAWSLWPYGPLGPWRVWGAYPGWSGPGWRVPVWQGLGWQGLGWGGRNAYLAPRYAPFAYQFSPYYEWPYEWSYEPYPDVPGAFPVEPPHRPHSTGPRRLYW